MIVEIVGYFSITSAKYDIKQLVKVGALRSVFDSVHRQLITSLSNMLKNIKLLRLNFVRKNITFASFNGEMRSASVSALATKASSLFARFLSVAFKSNPYLNIGIFSGPCLCGISEAEKCSRSVSVK